MKARVKPTYSKKEIEAMLTLADENARISNMRAQSLMILALNRAFGFGEARILKFLETYLSLVDDYTDFSEDKSDSDLLLQKEVQKICPNAMKEFDVLKQTELERLVQHGK